MKKLFLNPITAGIITLFSLLFCISLYQTIQEIKLAGQETKKTQKEIEDLSSDIMSLEEEIEIAKSDEFQEKLVRDELLMQKEGEYILKLPDLEEAVVREETTPEPTPTTWEAWRDVLND